MKKYLNLSVLLVLIAVLFASCENKDEVDVRDQFVATYEVNESYVVSGITVNAKPYSIIISKSTQDPTVILLSNFAGYGVSFIMKAEVTGSKFTISQQTVNTKGFSGSGSITGGNLSFSYQESSTEDTYNVQAKGIKL